MTERTYSMSELVQLTGFDARTIRYYISQGLLPKPLKRGRGADYGEIHLDRLKLISVLKGNLKLDEIQARLNVASPEEIRQLLEAWVEPKAKSSAWNYLDSVQEDFELSSMKMENLNVPTFVRRKKDIAGVSSLSRKEKFSAESSQLSAKEAGESYLPNSLKMDQSLRDESLSNPMNKLISKLDNSEHPNFKSSYRRARTWKVIQITPGIELHLKDPDDLTLARMERAGELIRNILTGVDDD
jgi:DNA-binding transcriptional MerR regulator